jgi:hypothetical protein
MDINTENYLLEYSSKMTTTMSKKFYTIPKDDIRSMAFICLAEERRDHPNNDLALEYVRARWLLFRYCGKVIKNEISDSENLMKKDISNLSEILEDKRYDHYNNLRMEKIILEYDMQSNLSEDALYVIAGVISLKLLKKNRNYNMSRVNIIADNLEREKGWDWKKSKKIIKEITDWWHEYFNQKTKIKESKYKCQ